MNPFAVVTEGDAGYLAQNSLSGSRLNTSLADLAAPVSAFTAEFIEDVGLRSVEEMVVYMPSAEIQYQEANIANFTEDAAAIRVRGLPATATVNYFPNNLRLDLYNTGRLDQSRGPNSILFGFGSPGGVINLSPNRASVGSTFGTAALAARSHEGLRATLDYNRVLRRDRLALRIAAVRDHGGTWRYNEYDHQDRVYLAAQYRVTPQTVVDAQFEYGKVNKSVGTPAGATDAYSIWAAAGKRISATANAALGVVSYGAADFLSVDTTTGEAWNMRNRMRSQPLPAVPGVGVVPYITDFNLLPKRTSLAAGDPFPQESKYTRASLFVTHAFTRDLNAEFAANTQSAPRKAINAATLAQIWADPNPTLPDGRANPNAGRPFLEGFLQRTRTVDQSRSLRGTLSWTHSFGPLFGRHAVAGLWQTDWSKTGLLQERLFVAQNPYSAASPENLTNAVRFRTYVDLDGPPDRIVGGDWRRFLGSDLSETISGRRVGARFEPFAPAASDNRFRLDSGMAVLQSTWLRDRLITVVGIREDRQHSWISPINVRGPATPGYLLGPYIATRGRTLTLDEGRNQTYSAMLKVTRWLGLTFNQASSFAVAPSGFTAIGPAPNPSGESRDFGVKLDLGQRLMFTATYFETSDTKGTRNLAGLGPEQVYKSIWAALGAANVRAPDGRPAIDLVPAASVYTFNSVTKGYELEAIANPTKNWRLYFNLTQSKSEETNLGSEAKSYYATYRDFWRQYERVLLDGSGRLAAVADDGSGVVDTVGKGLKSIEEQILTLYTLADGQRPRGQVPFKFNVRTAYSFREGPLKGLTAGAGVRHQDGQVVDYRPATTTSPARVQFGRTNSLLDLNLRYSHPLRWLGQRSTWSLQLNVNNALDQTKILPLRVSPTGAIVNYRFQTPREWVLTSKIGF
ncbi:TonB-dependent receptor plug domain-containing protein [Horticoccus sp. 23ND18S-11]|uniref:TonB-dependent receptor plug domain-containing protein n=1 Tax=Horticoccus sp. 23ND18S-11 TaxID=3391832 RepID=UPI0039C8C481